MKRFLSAAVLAVLMQASFLPVPAHAEGGLTVRKIDTTGSHVVLTVSPPSGKSEPVSVTENGEPVTDFVVSKASLAVGIVLVLDTSEATTSRVGLADIKNAARSAINLKTPNEKMAIVSAGSPGRIVTDYTDNTGALLAAVDTLGPSPDASTWRATQLAAGLAANAAGLQSNLLVITGSRDTGSPNALSPTILAALQDTKSTVYTIGLGDTTRIDVASLRQLSIQTGGGFAFAPNSQALNTAANGVVTQLGQQLQISYDSRAKAAMDITITIFGQSTTVHTRSGVVSVGTEVNAATVSPSATPFLEGMQGRALIAGVLLTAVALLAYGLLMVVVGRRSELAGALSLYLKAEEAETPSATKLSLFDKAVASTAKIAGAHGLLAKVELRLAQADLPLKPAEAIFCTFTLSGIAMIIGVSLLGFLGLIVAGGLFMAVPIVFVNLLGMKRRRKFNSQLPNMLDLLSGSLRAGYSLLQALDAVSNEMEAPMGSEIKLVVNEARLGRPPIDALSVVPKRMNSTDFEVAVMAMRIQHEVGGNLAELLGTIKTTMVNRERLRREVRTLTAEGRMSAIILVALPPLICLVLMFLNPGYLNPLFSTEIGRMTIGLSIVSMIMGWAVMQKIIQFKA